MVKGQNVFEEGGGWSEEQVRGFLKTHANLKGSTLKENCIRSMKIKGISPISTFIYRVESYVEHRSGSWVTVPYSGQGQDSTTNDEVPELEDPPPSFWEFDPTPPKGQHFEGGEETYILPDTTKIYTCPECGGCGEMDCDECHGQLQTRCKKCSGTGHTGVLKMKAVCVMCKRGKVDCPECERSGVVSCDHCHGQGRVTSAYEMEVFWEKEQEPPSIIVNGQSGPKYSPMLTHLKVKEFKDPPLAVFCSTLPQPMEFEDLAVQRASKEKMEEMSDKDLEDGTKIISFRQTIHKIDSTLVTFTSRGKEGEFIIYGPQNQLFFPNSYPKTSTCTCSLL